MTNAPRFDTTEALARYEAVRPRLPRAGFPDAPRHAATLAEIADDWDGFVLDAFGVLNVGDTPIPGAVDRMTALRAAGKRLCVLTNAASYSRTAAQEKYRRLGFDFAADEIVSSRDVAAEHLERVAPGLHWAAISAPCDGYEDIAAPVADLLTDERLWDGAGGFLFLSSIRWGAALQDRLVDSLTRNPRPVVIANPDLVAPREDGLSIEPGWWGHDLQDRTGLAPQWFGKPFADAFAVAAARMGPGRFAMVGDTLHTDILGGRAAGLGSVLVTGHGLFAGEDFPRYIRSSGIVPDAIVAST